MWKYSATNRACARVALVESGAPVITAAYRVRRLAVDSARRSIAASAGILVRSISNWRARVARFKSDR